MKVIKFIRLNSPYNEGELAGFDDKQAERYVDARVAVYVEQKKLLEVVGVETVKSKDRPAVNKMVGKPIKKK